MRILVPPARGRRALVRQSPWDGVIQEPVEPSMAAMSAKASSIAGRLLRAAHFDPRTEELSGGG